MSMLFDIIVGSSRFANKGSMVPKPFQAKQEHAGIFPGATCPAATSAAYPLIRAQLEGYCSVLQQ